MGNSDKIIKHFLQGGKIYYREPAAYGWGREKVWNGTCGKTKIEALVEDLLEGYLWVYVK